MKIDTKISILIRRRAALGDVVLLTGAVRELYKKYKGCVNIDIQTDHPEVFQNNPYVEEVFTYSQNKNKKWNLIFDLDNSYESNIKNHFLDSYYYYMFGENELDKQNELFCSDEQMQRVDNDLQSVGDKFIAVHMRKWWLELKNISPEIWIKIFERFLSEHTDYKVVTVGGPNDYSVEHPPFVNYNGRYSPSELSYFLNHAKCFVGIDSAPMHIAGTSDVPIVALLSHVTPEHVLPYRLGIMGYKCRVVMSDVPCVGCVNKQDIPVSGINCENNYKCSYTWNIDNIVKQIDLMIAG